MKPTGTLTFTRNPDGSISHRWEGGRVVAISRELLNLMGVESVVGRLFQVEDLNLRIVGHDFNSTNPEKLVAVCLVMREGLLARLRARFVRMMYKASLYSLRLERNWLGLKEGQVISKWSITGLLLRWV